MYVYIYSLKRVNMNSLNHNKKSLYFKGQLCGVCGLVGSGKSALITSILGQVYKLFKISILVQSIHIYYTI